MKNTSRAAVLLVGLFAGASAFAHSRLLASTPAGGAVLSQAPAALTLHFNEAVEVAFTTAELVGPSSQSIALKPAAGDEGSTVVAPLPALAPGLYRLAWTTVGRDGHHVKGTFAFTIR